MKWLFLILSIATGALGQVSFKWGINKETSAGLSFFWSLVTNPGVVLGFILYGISFALWMYVLRYFELSFARPFTSVGYIITYVISIFLLGESFSINRLFGVVLILIGVALLK